MRTTITLDKDVADKLNAEMRRSGKSFKETVNEFLRAGLAMRRELENADHFKVRPRRMGVVSGLNYDNIGELLEQLDGPLHK
jgi:hypothetical protein